MAIEADLVSMLVSADVAGGRIYSQLAPEAAEKPFVIYRATNDPILSISGIKLGEKLSVVLESWADTYQGAIDTTASIVQSLVGAAFLSSPVDDMSPETGDFVRSISFILVK